MATTGARRWLVCKRPSVPPGSAHARVVTDRSRPVNHAEQVRALIAAYEAALAVASELDLGAVMQRIADLAREVVPAHYAALDVADERGELERFVASGLTAEQEAALGPPPKGHGLLGVLIREGKPLLIPDIAADPRSVGCTPNRPPMRTLLGVPILLGDRALGNLSLTEHLDGQPFDEADVEALQVLAAHAAAAIDRARLYRQSRRAGGGRRSSATSSASSSITSPSGVLIQAAPDRRIALANAAAIAMVDGDAAPPARCRSTAGTCAGSGPTAPRSRPTWGRRLAPSAVGSSATTSSAGSGSTGGGGRSWCSPRRCPIPQAPSPAPSSSSRT